MIALATGIVVGVFVLAVVIVVSRFGSAAGKPGPTPLGWLALAAGSLALAGLGLVFVKAVEIGPLISIGLAVAAAIVCVGAIVKGDRHWPTWVGVGLAVVPVGFWIVFVVGEFLYPH